MDEYNREADDVQRIVENIEEKPHYLYIRYLLTKKYSPAKIKRELWRLALSAPHESYLVTYYMAVIDPLVEHLKLRGCYQDYRMMITQKGTPRAYKDEVMNFKAAFDGRDDAAKIRFCKLVKELGLEELWSPEIVRAFGGTIETIPLDENGERVIKHSPGHNVEKLLLHPKRPFIDQLLLEEIPFNRIARVLQEKFQVKIEGQEIAQYARVFFNYRRQGIEELLKSLEAEKNSVESQLELLEYDDTVTIGEKISIRGQAEQKLEQLRQNITVLTAAYSETSFHQGRLEEVELQDAWSEVFRTSFSRFRDFTRWRDRDIAKPLETMVKIMGYAQDHLAAVPPANGGTGDADKGKQEAALTMLYRERYDEHMRQQAAVQTGGEDVLVLRDDGDDATDNEENADEESVGQA